MAVSYLLVDDEELFRERLAKALTRRDLEVSTASNYDKAVKFIARQKPARAIVDLKMVGKSGLDIIKTGLRHHPSLKIVVLTGYGSIATATEAIKLGAIAYLTKPTNVDDILAAFDEDNPAVVPAAEKKKEIILAPSLARVEWEHINRVLHDCDNNISKAAKKLGIHRRTLQRKLQKYPPSI